MTFTGYRRPDGRVGVRNHVLVLPASVCASDVTDKIARQVEGAVSFHNQVGCSQVPADEAWTMEVLSGYAANPNVYGTLVVSLGCENCQMDRVVHAIREKTNKPIRQVIIQEAGGTLKAEELGVRCAKELVQEASQVQREEVPLSELILGTECGGSDALSGVTANPTIGLLSDWIVENGGTSILTEITELIGCNEILKARAKNEQVAKEIDRVIKSFWRTKNWAATSIRWAPWSLSVTPSTPATSSTTKSRPGGTTWALNFRNITRPGWPPCWPARSARSLPKNTAN